jgi:hypothetical protein
MKSRIGGEDAMRRHPKADKGRELRPGTLVLAAGLVAAMALAGGAGSGEAAGPAGQDRPQEKPAVVGPSDITFVDDNADQPARAGKPAANPFGAQGGAARKDAVPGYAELSTGLKVPGWIYTTRAARIKIYNLRREVYEYVPVPALKRIDTTVQWERMDKEWRFKEAGSPEKVYSGREYPVRKAAYTLTLRNDHKIHGHILGAPLYVDHNGKVERFILHDRDKGPIGSPLADLKYIKGVAFGPEAYNLAVEEFKEKSKAEAAAGKAGAAGDPAAPAPKQP